MRHLLALAALGALALSSSPALACGGLFCAVAQTQQPPAPVDQNAERILFEVDDKAGTISAHVQISYTGAPDSFAWIVPLPAVPAVEESSMDLLRDLDAATQLRIAAPPDAPCQFDDFGFEDDDDFGCGDNFGESLEGDFLPVGRPDAPDKGEPVIVYAQDVTNNYEYAVLSAEDPLDLVGWLQDSGYNVSDNMLPVISPYSAAGMKFLAVKLREGKLAQDIVPLKMTWVSPDGKLDPVIPLKLTAVAAQPLMGILVFVAADRPYRPSNFQSFEPNPRDILLGDALDTNYFEAVARKVDFAQGRAFITEYVGDNPLIDLTIGGHRIESAMISRFYTRLSPHHMTLDPIFSPHPDLAYRKNTTLDLSSRPPLSECGAPIPGRALSPCADNFCGSGSRCAELSNKAGCFCRNGQIAQRVQGPDQGIRVTCAPATNPFAVTDEAVGVGTDLDPCLEHPCGSGQCVVKGGFPACRCDPGALAVLDGLGLTCTPAPSDIPTFGPGAGPESDTATAALTPTHNPQTSRAFSFLLPFLLALAFPIVWRRRL